MRSHYNTARVFVFLNTYKWRPIAHLLCEVSGVIYDLKVGSIYYNSIHCAVFNAVLYLTVL